MEIPYSSSSTTLIPFPASKIILCSDRSTILLDEVQIVLCVGSLLRAPGFFFASPCFPDIACPAAGFCVCAAAPTAAPASCIQSPPLTSGEEYTVENENHFPAPLFVSVRSDILTTAPRTQVIERHKLEGHRLAKPGDNES